MNDPAARWFAVRTVYLLKSKADGTNVFEERVVTFSAATSDEAFEKAEVESDRYERDGGQAHPVRTLYQQDGDPLIEGYEVWSQLFQSRQTLEAFYESRYEAFEYRPD